MQAIKKECLHDGWKYVIGQAMKNMREATINPLISQIAFRIIEYVRRKDFPEGVHLVEQALANEFHVSRSPVHKALHLLTKEGVVLFKPNRGFFLARPAMEIAELDLATPASIEEDKYYQIAGDRVRGILKGHVSEVELRTTYGISRDKLIKILIRMSQEGWVERRPGNGWNFLPILNSADALDQSFRFRIALETAALLEPTYHVDAALFAVLRKEQEALIKTQVDSTVFSKMFEAGARFHEQIVACSGNPFFIEAIQHINRMRRLIEYNFKIDKPRLERYQDHIAILELLEAGNHKEASDLLRHHLNQARINRRQNSIESTGEIKEQ
jgi:DNA-binding GntR family transcriptional regulator